MTMIRRLPPTRLLALFCLALQASITFAQQAADPPQHEAAGYVTVVPETLGANLTFNDGFHVFASAQLADEGIVVGGNFTSIGGFARTSLARITALGLVDPAFNPAINGPRGFAVYAAAVQDDGKIIIGGDFTQVGACSCQSLARLLPDGRLDSTFTPPVVAGGNISAVLVQPDGKILVAGRFSSVGTAPPGELAHSGVARLNSNGTLDQTFLGERLDSQNPAIVGLTLQPDGKVLVNGYMTYYHRVSLESRRNLVRLNADGTLDVGLPDVSQGAFVFGVTRQADGKFLAVSGFGSPRLVTRFDESGVVDTSFDPQFFSASGNPAVHSLALQADRKLLVSGFFDTVDGASNPGENKLRNNIAQLDANGNLTTTFFDVGQTPTGTYPYISETLLQADGQAWLFGFFYEQPNYAFVKRYDSTSPSTQSLTIDPSNFSVTWARSGSLPELALPPVLYSSSNGANFTPIAIMYPIANGWRANTAELAPGTHLRVRGRTATFSGYRQSSSQGIVELTLRPDLIFANNFE